MQGLRYAAFTFIDRISALDEGISAQGTFHIPAHIDTFPSSLLAEATGQLAAWVAVAKLGFRVRPVAGIAHETEYTGVPNPGDTLQTEIRIDSCEEDAVAYQGSASINGKKVLDLRHCVGPMLPLEQFDDADAMREFFATLCASGAAVDRFAGVAPLPLQLIERENGRFARARIDVPTDAAFFADHFPRRPVFPGTLLLDRMTTLAAELARERVPHGQPFARLVTDVKLRAFTEPGSTLELVARLDEGDAHTIDATLEARVPGQRRPVGHARVQFGVFR